MVVETHATWREADAALRDWLAAADTWAARLETLRHDVEELAGVADDPQEIESLESEHRRLAHAQSLIEAAQAALHQVDEGEVNAHDQLAAAQQGIDAVVALDGRLAEALAALQTAEAAAAEAASDLRRYLDRADLDPDRLVEVEARLGELQRVARKHRIAPTALPALLQSLREELARLGGDGEGDAGAHLRRRRDAARAAYDSAAAALRTLRAPAAERLAEAITASMQRLSLAGGSFRVLLREEPEPTAHGSERTEFLVSANAGMPPGPLGRVASGGELSRIGLALSTAGAGSLAAGTLVFDEVDAGIGGGVAEVVGRMLQALGSRRQVLCVTHLAQVAACATTQFRVSKVVRDGLASSRVDALGSNERIDELARMIGGVEITEATRAYARELLDRLGSRSGGEVG